MTSSRSVLSIKNTHSAMFKAQTEAEKIEKNLITGIEMVLKAFTQCTAKDYIEEARNKRQVQNQVVSSIREAHLLLQKHNNKTSTALLKMMLEKTEKSIGMKFDQLSQKLFEIAKQEFNTQLTPESTVVSIKSNMSMKPGGFGAPAA